MTVDELRAELAAILRLEEAQPTDWHQIEARCLQTIENLNAEEGLIYPHDVVYHFLDDTDSAGTTRATPKDSGSDFAIG